MNSTLLRIWTAFRSRSGQGLVEYALILILAVVILISLLSKIGVTPQEAIGGVSNSFGGAH